MSFSFNTLCFDYYMTLVVVEEPFLQIKKWLKKYLHGRYPEIEGARFYSRFTRFRALVSTAPAFRTGIDLLTDSLKMTCKKFGIPEFHDEFAGFIEELFTSPPAYADAHLVIEQLKSRYQVGLLTNADNDILQKSISRLGFEFDFKITSEDARSYKPDKGIFLYAAEKLAKRAEELIMIGDSQVDDLLGSGRAGIRSIWINRGNEGLKKGIEPPLLELNSLSAILDHQSELEK